MSCTLDSSRRGFLKGIVSSMCAPLTIPVGVLASLGANDRIGIGYIGVGRRGNQLMDLPTDGRIVAVCDVDRQRAESKAAKQHCRIYQDYRQMLDATDIDAVFVATPDHWHALPSIHACQAEKDVYCEKPLGLTIREGQAMVKAARKYQRVFQVGMQRRSSVEHELACALVREGKIGKVHTVIESNYPSSWESKFSSQPIPQGLDWDVWCGQTEPAPYHEDIFIQRAKPGWISLRPYSGGEMTGTGAHGFDLVQWGLGTDHTGPVEVWEEGGKLEPVVYSESESRDRGDRLCSQGRRVSFRYANGVLLQLENQPDRIFVGEKGKIIVGYGKVSSDPPEIVEEARKEIKPPPDMLTCHIQNWFDCIRSREKPVADVEIGHRSSNICHLGNIARWIGRKLQWDPEKEIFPDDEEANQFLERLMRQPYQLPHPL